MEKITTADFEEKVLKTEGLVLVDFNADWCGPCQAQKPALESLAEGGARVLSVNIDDEPELAEKYEVSSIPCLVLFRDGEEVERKIGLQPKSVLADMLED